MSIGKPWNEAWYTVPGKRALDDGQDSTLGGFCADESALGELQPIESGREGSGGGQLSIMQ